MSGSLRSAGSYGWKMIKNNSWFVGYQMPYICQLLLRRMCGCWVVVKTQLKPTNRSLTAVFIALQNNSFWLAAPAVPQVFIGNPIKASVHLCLTWASSLYYTRWRRTTGLYSALFLKWNHENSIFCTLSSCLAMTLTSMEAADATNTRSLGDTNNEIKATH